VVQIAVQHGPPRGRGTQLDPQPAGALADRFGARRVLTLVVALWSVFTALTGLAWSLALGTGSNAIAEYMPEVARRFADPKATPEYLLWFHHVPWDYRLNSGLTLWEGLVARYDEGVADAAELARSWASVRPLIDAERWRAVSDDLAREQLEALWWRDASVAYFQSISKRPIPANSPQPAHPLSHYQVLRPPNLPGQRP